MNTRATIIGATIVVALLFLGIWEYRRIHSDFDYEAITYDYAPVVRK